ncbi:YdeI/OmpD-associated family protein [Bacillus sp. JJ1764]|uniref:YdeI/OmpD-associated family protein n=1 Tax=Bacillus sp. JJ1764 TaxID=3122964 RepID=UPI002FFE5D30
MPEVKSIVDKLGLQKYLKKLVLQKPEDLDELHELEFDSTIKQEQYDLIFAFVFSLDEFSSLLHEIIDRHLLEDNGYTYVAYPKKNNKKYKEYIDRDQLLPALASDEDGYVFNSQIKFSRMVSLNDTFTVVGLKSVPKKAKKTTSTKSSQCVDDYIVHIEDIKKYLSKNNEVQKVYHDLTPGYQKDWARYIYSAKRKETQDKRLLEMESVLAEGYKTIDLYKRRKK